jgi:proline iminopeptidase
MLGHEYLFEPTEFLLGPGGVENPSRLLVYLDPRATGRSSFGALGDADVTVEAHVRDVIGLVEHIDELLEEPREVDFLGHGYGAALAVLYAAEHPERVRRLVLSNPFPASVEDYARWLENAQARLTSSEIDRLVELTQFRVCLRDLDLCSQEQWRINGPTWACPENEAVIRDMDFRHIDYRAFGYYINRDLRELEYDWSPQMGRIMDIPSTIIWGPCDPIPESTLMTYTASIAGARAHVVPGSGHFTMTEQPEAFRRIVTGALTD